jgi:hypothetical protein
VSKKMARRQPCPSSQGSGVAGSCGVQMMKMALDLALSG